MTASIGNFTHFETGANLSAVTVTLPANSPGDIITIASFTGGMAVGIAGDLINTIGGWAATARVRDAGSNFNPELLIQRLVVPEGGLTSTVSLTKVNTTNGVAVTGVAFRGQAYNVEDLLQLLGAASSGATSVATLEVGGGVVADNTHLIGIIANQSSEVLDHAATGMTNVDAYANSLGGVTAGISVLMQTIASGADIGSRAFNWTGAGRACGVLLVLNEEITAGTTNFSGTPAVDESEVGYEANFLLTADGVASAVATKANSSTPTYTQIHAGQNSAGAAAEESDSKTVTASTASKMNLEPLEFPVYDVHIAASTNVLSYQDQVKLPPTDYQYTEVDLDGGALPGDSVLHPSTATGDFFEASEVVLPADVVINFTATGGFSLENVVEGRQYFFKRQYDYSAAAWLQFDNEAAGEYTLQYINNVAPEEILAIPAQIWIVGKAITPIVIDGIYFEDSEGDTLTGSIDPAFPAGISFDYDDDGRLIITGTPTETHTLTAHIPTMTDIAEDPTAGTAFNITVVAGVAVPTLTAGTDDEDSATTAIEGAGLVIALDYETSSTVTAGRVIGTSPSAGEIVAVGSTVTVVLSAGFGFTITIEPPIAVNNTGSIWPDTEADYFFYPGYTPETLLAATAAGVVTGCISGTTTSDSSGAWSIPINDNTMGELMLHIPYTDPLIDGDGPEDDVVFWQTVTPE